MSWAEELTNSALADDLERMADPRSGLLLSREERAWLRLAAARLRVDHGALHRDSQRVPERYRES